MKFSNLNFISVYFIIPFLVVIRSEPEPESQDEELTTFPPFESTSTEVSSTPVYQTTTESTRPLKELDFRMAR